MSHTLLTAASKNHIKINGYRHDPTVFDYRGITLSTNKGPSPILGEYQERDEATGKLYPVAKILVDKLAPNEALMLFRRVQYVGSYDVLEPVGYLSQKNNSTEHMILQTVNTSGGYYATDLIDRVNSLQDLPVHSLESVTMHVPYDLHVGGDHIPRDYYNELSGFETITRPAGVGVPPSLTFGRFNTKTPREMVTLDSADSRNINHFTGRVVFLDLPSIISGVPRFVEHHGGKYVGVRKARTPQNYVIILRFSEDV